MGFSLRLAGYPMRVRTLYEIMTGAMLVHLVIHLFLFAAEVSAFVTTRGQLGPIQAFPVAADMYVASYFIFGVAALIGSVTWFHWLDRSVKNLYADRIENFGRTPLQIVMAYMTPGPNLYRPLKDLKRLYGAFAAGEAFDEVRAPSVLTIWWLVSLVQLGLMGAELRFGFSVVTLLSGAFSIATAALGLVVLRKMALVQPYWRKGGRRGTRMVERPRHDDTHTETGTA
ncbi:DUF4328 domain-containing protein [Parvularcula sp. LCG005]|uniref:DUF4328 domain-containing protein n=1 Tax=Parvularcula sp. LCG005 TaxID=3078805 RepID=UPI0029434FEF|nr:DUF4328 domain-containing protein [Parvularcula sp. LCG005]WOI52869.1 DUF4328 domain-containing protein [Parvularcula sp. LCG005]